MLLLHLLLLLLHVLLLLHQLLMLCLLLLLHSVWGCAGVLPLKLPLGLLMCSRLLLVLQSAQHHPRLSLVLLHWLLSWLQLAGHSKLCRKALLHVLLVMLLGLLLILHWQTRGKGQLSACFCCGVCRPFPLLHDDHHVLLLVLLLVRRRC